MNDLTSQSNKYCIDDTHLNETKKLEKEINQHERAIEFLYKTKSKQENSHQMTKRVEKFLSQNQKKLVKKEIDPYQKQLKIILYDLFEEDDQIYKIIHGSNSNGSLFFAAKYKKNDKELMTLVFQERYTHEQLEFMKCPQELRENNYCWIRTSWNCSQSNYFDKIKEYETIEELEIDLANFNHS